MSRQGHIRGFSLLSVADANRQVKALRNEWKSPTQRPTNKNRARGAEREDA
jgi:hypothetical protein